MALPFVAMRRTYRIPGRNPPKAEQATSLRRRPFGDPAQQGADPEHDQVGDQAAADHGRPQPGRQPGPAEHVVGDH
ncbi:MAG TPA: hypothetical protein VIJ32_14270, partial [Actinomycetes bacterium]